MNHHTYEEWLFADLGRKRPEKGDLPLTLEQKAALQEHLQTCESCRLLAAAWREVETDLWDAPMAEPAPGFTSRWQATLLIERKRLERRQSLAMLAFVVGAVVLLVGSLVVLSLPALRSPTMVVVAWFYQLAGLYSLVDTGQAILRGLLDGFTLPVLILAAGIFSQISVLWVVSYRLLMRPRRVQP